ncbi:M16 family metallopeptidase [Advenella sp. RU8]|uniref:M16 family metallopeptidase n=1 Tax=Advenella sp. RU8 TaxID=3399575 RepID=UPI003AAC9EFF
MSSPIAATGTPTQPVQTHSIEGITEYVLGNGLRVLLAPDQSKPTTTVNMTYLVGSRHEQYGRTGMAHLLEHLMFRGTPNTPNALAEFSKRGLQANGSTSADRTNYYASFASNPETLKWYLTWQADAMRNASIQEADLNAERSIVLNELERGENNPFRTLTEKMRSTAYQWHNYRNSTIGARSDLDGMQADELRDFYDRYYQPDNAVLVVAGQFAPAQTLKLINELFGSIPRPERALNEAPTVEPQQDGKRQVTLERSGGMPFIAATYHIPAASSEDYILLDMAANILADSPSGQLYKKLVENNLATGVFGFAMAHYHPGLIFFGAQLNDTMDIAKAQQTLHEVLEQSAANPITQEQLDRAKNNWLTQWDELFASTEQMAIGLSEAIASGDWRLFFLERDRVKNITLADVQRAIQTYLVSSNRTSGLYKPTDNPQRAPFETVPDIAQLLKDYKGDPTFTQTESFDSSPENIDKLTQREVIKLPNGTISTAMLVKPTRGNRVQADYKIQFANAEALNDMASLSAAAASLITSGTATMSRQQIQDRIDALQGSIHYGISGNRLMVSVSTQKKYFPDLLQFSLELIQQANYPLKEVDEYKERVVTSVRNAMTEPGALANNTLSRHSNIWPKGDIRYVPTYEELIKSIQAVNPKALREFKTHFFGAGDIDIAVVGDFDPKQIKHILEDSLNSWKQAPAYERIETPYHSVKPATFTIETPDKANAVYMARLPVEMQNDDPDYPALFMANYLLGATETSRLWTRIRTQAGLSYSIRSALNISSFEPSGTWSLQAIYSPTEKEHIKSLIDETIQTTLKEGFTEEELNDGIRSVLNLRSLARSQDSVLSSTWLKYLALDRSFEWNRKFENAIQNLTVAEVHQAMKKYLKPENMSEAFAGDFEGKKN